MIKYEATGITVSNVRIKGEAISIKTVILNPVNEKYDRDFPTITLTFAGPNYERGAHIEIGQQFELKEIK